MYPVPAAPRRQSPLAPWLGVGITLVALLTATSTLGAPAAAPTAGAARWLPPDGTRQAWAAAGALRTVEWSRPTPNSLMQFNSPTFLTWAKISEGRWTEASYLRVSGQRLDDRAQVQSTTEQLWTLDDTGAMVIAESSSDGDDTIWEPGRPELPADLAAGRSWNAEGAVASRSGDDDWTATAYHADYRAAAPNDPEQQFRGCVVVTTDLTVDDRLRTSVRTWCPGSGVVAETDGDTTWAPTTSLPRLDPAPNPAFDWSRVNDLEFVTRAHSQPGTGMTFLSPVSPPGLLPDGRLVVADRLMPDLLALDPSTDPPLVTWAARPGGFPTSAASFAGITVVTTSQRGLIGYGPGGQALWERRLDDLTRIVPVLLGDDTAVVVTLDGQVTGYDLATGEQRWQAGMGTEIRRTPVVAGDRLLVADAGGALSCFDATGAELWTIDAGRVASLAITAGDDPLVAVGRSDSKVIRAYSLADGNEVWQQRILKDANDLFALGDRLVLRDDDQLVGLDAATGAPLWAQPIRSLEGASGGEKLLVLTGNSLVAFDSDGQQLREWPLQLGITGSTHYLSVSEGAVIAFGPTGVAIGRTP